MPEASLTSATTVVVVVHGVGDHCGGQILQKAKQGLKGFAEENVEAHDVTIPGLPGLADDSGHTVGLKIKAGQDTHIIVPVIWSRLRPRAAHEADLEERYPSASTRVFDRLFQPLFYLLPSSINAVRCIPAAKGVLRRSLVVLLALCYAVVVPVMLLSGFYFVSYLMVHRAALDDANYLWWRILILMVILWLLDWLLLKLLIVLDFIGDVVSYTGNQKHRRKAEERLLNVVRAVSATAPQAQIVIVGHSLGSVLVTHAALRFAESENLGRRLHIVTMGSPLRVMSRFFPSRISTPEHLLTEFESRNLVLSWVNLWRDADFIGRALKLEGRKKFGETSLGDGTHSDYWADARSWQTTVKYLHAIADQSWGNLVLDWKDQPLSEADKFELFVTRKFRSLITVFLWLLCLTGIWSLDYFWNIREKIFALNPINEILVYMVSGFIWIPLVLWYVLATSQVGFPNSSPREMLSRYRYNWRLATGFRKLAITSGVLAGLAFILWRSLEAGGVQQTAEVSGL